jgi:hypothetical protein
MPIWNWYRLRSGGQAIPNLFDELQPLLRRKLENLVP